MPGRQLGNPVPVITSVSEARVRRGRGLWKGIMPHSCVIAVLSVKAGRVPPLVIAGEKNMRQGAGFPVGGWARGKSWKAILNNQGEGLVLNDHALGATKSSATRANSATIGFDLDRCMDGVTFPMEGTVVHDTNALVAVLVGNGTFGCANWNVVDPVAVDASDGDLLCRGARGREAAVHTSHATIGSRIHEGFPLKLLVSLPLGNNAGGPGGAMVMLDLAAIETGVTSGGWPCGSRCRCRSSTLGRPCTVV